MKRSAVIIGALCAICILSSMGLTPTFAQAVTPSPSPLVTATVPTITTPSPLTKKAEREAARQAYQAAMEQAQNGRDLAFADANATLMQSLATAGKDRLARKAARDAYKASATGIVSAYKTAIATARQDLKTALATINGK